MSDNLCCYHCSAEVKQKSFVNNIADKCSADHVNVLGDVFNCVNPLGCLDLMN